MCRKSLLTTGFRSLQTRYPALLLAEWWLPADVGRRTFTAEGPHGVTLGMAGVDELLWELRELDGATHRAAAGQRAGSPDTGPGEEHGVGPAARMGLAVLLDVAEFAAVQRTPLLLDY